MIPVRLRYAVSIVDIGCRIIIWGPTGSGKTTVAARIAECLAARLGNKIP